MQWLWVTEKVQEWGRPIQWWLWVTEKVQEQECGRPIHSWRVMCNYEWGILLNI